MFLQPLIRTLPTPKTSKETPSSIRNNSASHLNPILHRSVNRSWSTQSSHALASNNYRTWTTLSHSHQQQPLSIVRHLSQPSPSTTATSRLVYTTNYHLPIFDTVLTNSVQPSYQMVNPTFRYPTSKAPIFPLSTFISSASS